MRELRLGIVGFLGFCLPSVLGAIVLPGAEEVARSEAAFELCPGVVVDPTAATVYAMNPGGGIDAVSVATGELLWSTQEAAKPLALYGDLLIAQAAGSARSSATLEIVLLDALRGGERQLAFSIDLPAGVSGAVDEGMGVAFSAHAAVREGQPVLWWESIERYVKGVAPSPDEALESRQQGAYRLDLGSHQAVAVDLAAIAAATPALPAQVQAWEDSGVLTSGVVRVGNLLSATEVINTAGSERILLKRWDAGTGAPLPDLTLFSGPHILEMHSADRRHLLVAERRDPGRFTEYEWSIFSLETGMRLGQVSHHQSHARWFVAGNIVTYLERPYGHLVQEEWVDEPRKLRAILLGSAAFLWERPLRDTAYQGAFPP